METFLLYLLDPLLLTSAVASVVLGGLAGAALAGTRLPAATALLITWPTGLAIALAAGFVMGLVAVFLESGGPPNPYPIHPLAEAAVGLVWGLLPVYHLIVGLATVAAGTLFFVWKRRSRPERHRRDGPEAL